ncbi:hypothetical protein BDQ17DRAFT_451620 [Cyathus striatus]|nr:hypothetical protein BDQ17DRAFT_451620 [Cyathus striatus]
MSFSRRFGLQLSAQEGYNPDRRTMKFPVKIIHHVMGSFSGTITSPASEKRNNDHRQQAGQYHGQPTYTPAQHTAAVVKTRRALPPPPVQASPPPQQSRAHILERKILTHIPDFDDTTSEETYTTSSSEGDYHSGRDRGSEASSYMTASTSSSHLSLPLASHCHSTHSHSQHSHITHTTPVHWQDTNGNGNETSLPPPPRKNAKRPVITSEPVDPASETLCSVHGCAEPCFVCEPPRWAF